MKHLVAFIACFSFNQKYKKRAVYVVYICICRHICICLCWLYTSEKYRNAYSAGKESTCNEGDPGSIPGRKIHWRRDRLPTLVFLGFSGGSDRKEFTCNVGDLGLIPGSGRSPGGGKATHTSILAWKIQWTEEPGSL